MRPERPGLTLYKTKNLRAVQLLLGHTKLDSTIRKTTDQRVLDVAILGTGFGGLCMAIKLLKEGIRDKNATIPILCEPIINQGRI